LLMPGSTCSILLNNLPLHLAYQNSATIIESFNHFPELYLTGVITFALKPLLERFF